MTIVACADQHSNPSMERPMDYTHTPHKVDEDKPAGVHKYNQMFNTILQTMLVGIFDDTVAVDRQLAETQADKLQVTVTE